MKANKIMDELYAMETTANYSHTCDTLKAGDAEKEVKKVAVTMFGTPDLLKEAAAWGADMLIVHEPMYFVHGDHIASDCTDPIILSKIEAAKESGMAVYRYHDHMHHHVPDMIGMGQFRAMGLSGRFEKGPYYAVNRIILDEPITVRALGRLMREKLGLAAPKMCGALDTPITRISAAFGTPGHLNDELLSEDVELILTGESDEWSFAEKVKEAGQLGFTKAMIVMGHIGSEREGMRYLADILQNKLPELEVRYMECGEVYEIG
ncbi:MAG: hypothetical protein E7616_03750 [Ruminococcaceae bacterium]|nr:hypothetical protein [Oscillospiraceae bacterium]